SSRGHADGWRRRTFAGPAAFTGPPWSAVSRSTRPTTADPARSDPDTNREAEAAARTTSTTHRPRRSSAHSLPVDAPLQNVTLRGRYRPPGGPTTARRSRRSRYRWATHRDVDVDRAWHTRRPRAAAVPAPARSRVGSTRTAGGVQDLVEWAPQRADHVAR